MRSYWKSFFFFTSMTLTLNSTFASSENFKVWSSASGLRSITTCEHSKNSPSLSPVFQELAEQVIEVKEVSPATATGEAFFPLVGSFWQPVQENGSLATIECATGNANGTAGTLQTFLLFDVIIANQLIPVARIAVANESASIFKSIQIHSIEDAEKILAERVPASEAVMTAQAFDLTHDVKATVGNLDYVACFTGTRLNVRDQTLNNVLFTVNKYATAKPVQSFGIDKLQKTISGRQYDFIKVQFPDTTAIQNIGWVADDYIKLRSECPGAGLGSATPPLASSNTWTFPLLKRPTVSYRTGMRAYGASRSGGKRLHAAADLYRIDGEQVLSVASGKIIRDRYYFYEGTYAIEVQHTGGKVVRYGEIKGKAAPNVSLGKTLVPGQTVGYIGTVNSGCCKPMLHFEMYAGTATGSLTQSGANKYSRRRDLMNPTTSLVTWEKSKFGVSF